MLTLLITEKKITDKNLFKGYIHGPKLKDFKCTTLNKNHHPFSGHPKTKIHQIKHLLIFVKSCKRFGGLRALEKIFMEKIPRIFFENLLLSLIAIIFISQ